MSHDRNQRVYELFLAALEKPESGREAWLQEACDHDEGLIAEVRELLHHDQPTADPLEHGLNRRLLGDAEVVNPKKECGLHVRCPHCHHPIELVDGVELGEFVCDSCGSSFSLIAASETKSYSAEKPTRIAHFELIDRVGIGAFGSVFKAKDTSLDRIVAIKIPRKGQLTGAEAEQFLREARTSAQLRHPNIVAVHEVGREDDRIFIVSDFVHGLTLSDWLTGARPSFRETAELCITIARALQYAHERGVIHRDLKPGNIMLDRGNQPYLMDFGLAKREAGEITMTMEGQILGTPAYMSPEQAKGDAHRVDGTTDVYSLGVILFEMLTGELPFRGNTRMLLHQVLTEDVPNPRKYNSLIPRDIETICLKCLDKSSARRYGSAKDLADDLQRFVDHKAVSARPVTRFEKTIRWGKRNPLFASVIALLFLTMALGTTISCFFAVQANGKTVDLKKSLRARDAAANELSAQKQLVSKNLLAAQTAIAKNCLQRAMNREASGDLAAAKLWTAKSLVSAGQIRPAFNLLRVKQWPDFNQLRHKSFEESNCREKLSNLERQVVERDRQPGGEFAIVNLNDGRTIADSICRLEFGSDLAHENGISNLPLNMPRFCNNRSRVIGISKDGLVSLWNSESGRIEAQFNSDDDPLSLAVSSNSRYVAIATAGEVILWNVLEDSSIEIDCFRAKDPLRYDLEVHPGGKLVAVIDSEGKLQVVNLVVENDEQFSNSTFVDVEFTNDGHYLVGVTNDLTVKVWSVEEKSGSLHQVKSFEKIIQGEASVLFQLLGRGRTVLQLSPHGYAYSLLTTGSKSGPQISIFERYTGKSKGKALSVHGIDPVGIDFSTERIAIADDSSVKIFDMANSEATNQLLQPSRVTSVLVKDNEMLVGCSNREFLRWQLTASDSGTSGSKTIAYLSRSTGVLLENNSIKVPRSKSIQDDAIRIFREMPGLGRSVQKSFMVTGMSMEKQAKFLIDAALNSGNDLQVAWLTKTVENGETKFFNLATQNLVPEASNVDSTKLRLKSIKPVCMDLGKDGKLIAIGYSDGSVGIYGKGNGDATWQQKIHDQEARFLKLDPREKWIVSGAFDGTFAVSDLSTGNQIYSENIESELSSITVSRDGGLAAVATWDEQVRLYSTDKWSLHDRGLNPDSAAISTAFSRDASLLATGGFEGQVQVWNVHDGQPIGELLNHERKIVAMCFDPSNTVLATVTDDGVLTLWEYSGGYVLQRKKISNEEVLSIDWFDSARSFAVLSNSVTLVPLPVPVQGDPHVLKMQTELSVNAILGNHGQVESLKTEDWQKIKSELERVIK